MIIMGPAWWCWAVRTQRWFSGSLQPGGEREKYTSNALAVMAPCPGGCGRRGEGNQRRLPGGSYINLKSLGKIESQAKKREDGASVKFQAEAFLWLPCSHQGEKVPGLKGKDGFLLQEWKQSGMADAWEVGGQHQQLAPTKQVAVQAESYLSGLRVSILTWKPQTMTKFRQEAIQVAQPLDKSLQGPPPPATAHAHSGTFDSR